MTVLLVKIYQRATLAGSSWLVDSKKGSFFSSILIPCGHPVYNDDYIFRPPFGKCYFHMVMFQHEHDWSFWGHARDLKTVQQKCSCFLIKGPTTTHLRDKNICSCGICSRTSAQKTPYKNADCEAHTRFTISFSDHPLFIAGRCQKNQRPQLTFTPEEQYWRTKSRSRVEHASVIVTQTCRFKKLSEPHLANIFPLVIESMMSGYKTKLMT